MSADNGHFVERVQGEDNLYGIFYYTASDDAHPAPTRERAIKLFSHPIAAILGAYRLEHDWLNATEYGISVTSAVLEDCRNMFRPEGWEVKK